MDKKQILTLNNISEKGLDRLPRDGYEVASEFSQPDAILLRSSLLHEYEFANKTAAIGRAGAGVNNIPVDRLTETGVAVFNAPGANANAVKELVLAGMLLGCRNIAQAFSYTQGLSDEGEGLSGQVEEGKKAFAGFELPGKTLGVIGLGAIGVQVANAARALGMKVVGFDPTITVQRAWELSSDVQQGGSVSEVLRQADFVTFHVPLLESTRHLINADRLAQMKDGVVIINFARGGIVEDSAVIEGLDSGKVYAYICDFPTPELISHPRVVTLPHLGASTAEAEENCAIMVADQVREYLDHGNVVNSVNFPSITLARAGKARLSIVNVNRPDMVGRMSRVLGASGLNIAHMANESKGNIAYTLVDVDDAVPNESLVQIRALDGVLRVRLL